jgi:hypothetical protein
MRLLWRLERRGSRCSRGGDDLADYAVIRLIYAVLGYRRGSMVTMKIGRRGRDLHPFFRFLGMRTFGRCVQFDTP